MTLEPLRKSDLARLTLTRLNIEQPTRLYEFFQKVTEISAEYLNVERSSIWFFVDGRTCLRCVELFERSKQTHLSGPTLHVSDFPHYFSSVSQRKTLPCVDVESDPRTQDLLESYLRPLNITSLLDGSIYIDGQSVGVVSNEHTGSCREWSTEECDFVGSIADILALKIRATELEQVRVALQTQESQLAEYRKRNSLAEMAAGVAHDFKNLLMIILGSAELISQTEGLPNSVKELTNQIIQSSHKGNELAKELMDFARPGPHSSRVLNVAQVLQRQLSQLQSAAGSNYQVTLSVRSNSGSVFISENHLERIVLNLVLNARDAMPNGGTISITVDSVLARDNDNHEGPFILISVTDTGTGIDPSVLDKIFDPFFTTKPRGLGTGLGLAVMNQIVNFAGGFIRVQTQLGQGTTFLVYLPRISSHG